MPEAAGVPVAESGRFKLCHTAALRQMRRCAASKQRVQWLVLSDVAALTFYRRVRLAQVEVV